jgi:hypothetical protein
MNENILNEYKILSVLRLFPLFAVKTEEELQGIQAICKLKLREIKNLKLIEQPPVCDLEEKLYQVEKETNLISEKSFKFLRLNLYIIGLIIRLMVKHYVVRITMKKLICEEDILELYDFTAEMIDKETEKNIKKLAGI